MNFKKSSLLTWVVAALLGIGPAEGAGGKRPGNSTPPPAETPKTARPVRPVILKPVATLPFTLPGGNRIDLSNDLNQYLETAVTETGFFAPFSRAQGFDVGSCDEWIEIRAALSTVELNLTQIGVRVGYSLAQGETSVVQSVSGSVKATLGLLGMDFGVYQCNRSGCMAIARTSKDQRTYSGELSFDIDFGQISTGPSLVINTPFGKVLRAAMKAGTEALAQSAESARLGWSATVREWNAEQGTLIFDQGLQAKLNEGEKFEVYAKREDTDSSCSVFKAVALVRASRVFRVSTEAQVDQILDSRGIQVGDRVMIHTAK
ncbi:MAG: hypothetical protein JNL01_13760 [Bdellovibrionales bacterium]|nr:hypothetical protein [Bdellovibrionales bacterium]